MATFLNSRFSRIGRCPEPRLCGHVQNETNPRYNVTRYSWKKSNDGAGRKDEDDAAAAARTGSARVAPRGGRRPLAGRETTGGEAGRRSRPWSRARGDAMDRDRLRI